MKWLSSWHPDSRRKCATLSSSYLQNSGQFLVVSLSLIGLALSGRCVTTTHRSNYNTRSHVGAAKFNEAAAFPVMHHNTFKYDTEVKPGGDASSLTYP